MASHIGQIHHRAPDVVAAFAIRYCSIVRRVAPKLEQIQSAIAAGLRIPPQTRRFVQIPRLQNPCRHCHVMALSCSRKVEFASKPVITRKRAQFLPGRVLDF